MSAASLAVALSIATTGAAQDVPVASSLTVDPRYVAIHQTTRERGRVRPTPITARGKTYAWSCARPPFTKSRRTIACVITGPKFRVRYTARDGRGSVSVVVWR